MHKFLLTAASVLLLVGFGCKPAPAPSANVNAGTGENVNVSANANTNVPPPVACTLEAKQCPDGSFVGRSGPNCEFEACPGEAGSTKPPSAEAKLKSKEWVWLNTRLADGSVVTPKEEGRFTVTFGADGRMSGKTDCNSYFGEFRTDGDRLMYTGPFGATKMFCEGAQESVFMAHLEASVSYEIAPTGNLVLKQGTGSTMTFR